MQVPDKDDKTLGQIEQAQEALRESIEQAKGLAEKSDRLLKKHKAAANFIPAPEITRRAGATFGVVTIGSCDPAVHEGLDRLAEVGIAADSMRLRGFPFSAEVEEFFDTNIATNNLRVVTV